MTLLRCITAGRSLSKLSPKKVTGGKEETKRRRGEGKEIERREKAWHKD